MSTVQRVAKNTGVLIFGNITFRLISLIVVIYLARYLGTIGFGKYSFVFAYLVFFSIITDLGLQTILIREFSREPSAAPKLTGNAYLIKLVLTVSAFTASIAVISFTSYPEDTKMYVYIAAFSLLFTSFSDLYDIVFQANLRMDYNVIAKVSSKLFSAVLIFWIIFSKGTLTQIIIVLVLSEMVKTLVSYSFSRKLVRPRFEIDFKLWKYLFKEALPLTFATFIWVIYSKIDIVMLSALMGDADVGIYSAGNKLCEPLFLIPNALLVSLFPIMSRYFKNSEELTRICRLSFKYILIIILPIAIGVSFLSDELILLIYGSEFKEASIVLKILVWMVLFVSLRAIFGRLLTAIGKQVLGLYMMLIGVIANIILNLILIPLLSYTGASVASLVSSLITFTIGFYFISKSIGIIPVHKILGRPALSCLSMGIFVFFINVNLFLKILVATGLYFLFLLALNTFSEEDAEIAEKILGRDVRFILNYKKLILKILGK